MNSKVVLVNRFGPPDTSATAQILSDLVMYLAKTGFDVHVIASRSLYGQAGRMLAASENIGGVHLHRVYSYTARNDTLISRLFSYIAFYVFSFFKVLSLCDRNTVVIVKTDPPLLCVSAGIAARVRGATTIQWVQDLYPEIAAAFGVRLLGGRIGRALAVLRDVAFRHSWRIVAIGELMRERIAARGIDPARIVVLPNWTDDETIIPSPVRSVELRSKWDIPADAFVVEYSGNLGRAHEYATLMDAARRLRDRVDIVFLFIGGGAGLAQLRTAVSEDGLASFRFAPYEPRDMLPQSLGAGDAHWLSLRPEFEGLIVPSKMFGICAAGRAVIAVCDAAGEVSRFLGPGDACITVPPGDGQKLAAAIVALADDRPRCDALGARARGMLDAHARRSVTLAAWGGLIDDAARANA